MGDFSPPYLPSFLFFLRSILLIWSIKEFEGFPVNWSQARRVYWHPLTSGSSGTIDNTLSSWALNSSTVHFVKFLNWLGKQLNNLGPCTWKQFSRKVFILELEVSTNFGILHILPSLFLESAEIPQLGAKPSSTFHTSNEALIHTEFWSVHAATSFWKD